MRKISMLVLATFCFSTLAGLAAEPAKQEPAKQDPAQVTSKAMNDLGKNMNKAGAAVKSGMNNLETKVKQGANSKAANNLENGAKSTLKNVEAGADKAEHAIVTTVKGAGATINAKTAPAKKSK